MGGKKSLLKGGTTSHLANKRAGGKAGGKSTTRVKRACGSTKGKRAVNVNEVEGGTHPLGNLYSAEVKGRKKVPNVHPAPASTPSGVVETRARSRSRACEGRGKRGRSSAEKTSGRGQGRLVVEIIQRGRALSGGQGFFLKKVPSKRPKAPKEEIRTVSQR